jgi:hypothetical protein
MNFPRNYLRRSNRPNIIDLNAVVKKHGTNQPKYKEGDKFLSKKIIQGFKYPTSMNEIVRESKFDKNMKEIDDIKIDGGKIFYYLKGAKDFLQEEVLEMNYIQHFSNGVLVYLTEFHKNDKK